MFQSIEVIVHLRALIVPFFGQWELFLHGLLSLWWLSCSLVWHNIPGSSCTGLSSDIESVTSQEVLKWELEYQFEGWFGRIRRNWNWKYAMTPHILSWYPHEKDPGMSRCTWGWRSYRGCSLGAIKAQKGRRSTRKGLATMQMGK